MRVICIVLSLILVAGCQASGTTPDPLTEDPITERETPMGRVIGGNTIAGAHAWLGVPFAKPPVGELRWRAPRSTEPATKTLSATRFSERCPQFVNGMLTAQGHAPGTVIGNEDCLYLNIYAPKFQPSDVPQNEDRIPVMMWIHGGGNTWGAASDWNGGALATRHNVIVVTVQYRMGPLGWFAHNALRETVQTRDDESANFGTLDLIAALEWIKGNISAFGGDPNRVTIFGESAGGRNVASLVLSPRAEGLFHRAIVQSGIFANTSLDTAETGGTDNGHAFATHKVIPTLLDGISTEEDLSPSQIAKLLRSLPVDDIYRAYAQDDGSISLPQVIADGVVLPTEGYDALSVPGAINTVPIISGTNRDELKLFNLFNEELVDRYIGFLMFPKEPDIYNAISDYQSLDWRIRAVDGPLAQIRSSGYEHVFAYRFDWDEEGTHFFTDYSQLLGAGHAVEIPFVFGHFELLGRADALVFNDKNAPGRNYVSGAMMSYWAEFAYTGDPGRGRAGKLPKWNKWGANPNTPNLLVFDTEEDGGIRTVTKLETHETLFETLNADPRLSDGRDRCMILDALVDWNPALNAAANTHRPKECAAP